MISGDTQGLLFPNSQCCCMVHNRSNWEKSLNTFFCVSEVIQMMEMSPGEGQIETTLLAGAALQRPLLAGDARP